MKIIVTLTNKIQCTDYQLNNDMIIKDALKIIEENDSFNLPDNLQYIYSSRSKKKVSIYYSFKQAKIVILIFIKLKEKASIYWIVKLKEH